MPFSDTLVQVIDVYKGSAPQQIWIMQTGNESIGVVDGPLFARGEDAILFLVDISDDKIHAHDRALYRVVNPNGRYIVQGTRVFLPAPTENATKPPATLEDLVQQIRMAVGPN
jgi:hypothetical protein